jgi:hypothetical protein
MEDYESTTDQAIKQAKKPLPTPEDRAQLIASSGIAAYRMTYRYVHTLQELKEASASSYLDNELNGITNPYYECLKIKTWTCSFKYC